MWASHPSNDARAHYAYERQLYLKATALPPWSARHLNSLFTLLPAVFVQPERPPV